MRYSELKQIRVEKGVCVHCAHRPPKPGKLRCQTCLDAATRMTTERSRKRRAILKSKRMCTRCGKSKAERGKTKCWDCGVVARAKERRDTLSKYGIDLKEFRRLLDVQAGGCAICRNLNGKRRLAVDHCHKTGKVRGLLCTRCNVGLGAFLDSIDKLKRAIAYLRASTAS